MSNALPRTSGWTLATLGALAGCSSPLPVLDLDAAPVVVTCTVGSTRCHPGVDAGVDGGGGTDSGFVLGTANGTVTAWITAAPLPHPRANHCAVAIAGHLLVIGGNYMDADAGAFVNLSAIDGAELFPDGGLGPWSTVGNLPNPGSQCTAAADATRVYVIDALYDNDAIYGAQVWSAAVAPDGTVGSFTSLAPLPGTLRVISEQAWVRGTTLIAADSATPPDFPGTLSIALDLSQPASGWALQPWSPDFRGNAQYALTDQYAYQLGGYDAGTLDVVPDTLFVPLLADGGVGPSTAMGPLPQPTAAGDAVAVDGYVYLVGGKSSIFGASGIPAISSAPIQADGSLGAWSLQATLPEGRTHERVTLWGNFLYVTGGGFAGPGLDTVFVSRVRF